eukprot:5260993-Lingulodinium_polyedra.AAC.1
MFEENPPLGKNTLIGGNGCLVGLYIWASSAPGHAIMWANFGTSSWGAHLCVAFFKRCTAMRSSRLSAAAAVRKSHACAFHARASFLARAWSAQ